MKKISKLTIAFVSLIPALSFAASCPDVSTISIVGGRVIYGDTTKYKLVIEMPIKKDMNPIFERGILSTLPRDNATVVLGTVECVYYVGNTSKNGAFVLKTNRPDYRTVSDKVLNQTGWYGSWDRSQFYCEAGSNCNY